jgi:hypothetical protein
MTRSNGFDSEVDFYTGSGVIGVASDAFVMRSDLAVDGGRKVGRGRR